MTSPWGKFLAPVTIPTGGYDWAWSNGEAPISATVPAGTYDTVLHVAAALEAAIDALPVASTVTVSEVGIVAVTIDSLDSMTWGSTDDALSAMLGFDESETVSGTTVTGSSGHEDGWYPGVITYGSTRGEGLSDDDVWAVIDKPGQLVAGSGDMRSIRQARGVYRRDLTFSVVGRTEALLSRKKGPKAFEDRWATSVLRWYMDRSVGAPGSYGTQGDPADYDIDDDCDYYEVNIVGLPKFRRHSKSTEHYSVRLTLHAGPD